MSIVSYVRANGVSRRSVLAGVDPPWIANRPPGVRAYIRQVVLSAPPWVDRTALLEIRNAARRCTAETGVLHVMDHIVPLRHPKVCGLTVPWNLEIISNYRNNQRGNRWCHDVFHEQLELL